MLLLMISSGRPLSSAIAGALSMSVLWIHNGRSILCVLVGLAMTVVTMFGFVVNDVFDYRKDSRAGVKRPVAAGSLPQAHALLFSALLLAAVSLLSAVVGSGGVMAFTALALVLYTPFARRWPLLKGLYVAGLCLLPLYYATSVAGTRASWGAYAVLVLFILGRETLMDADEAAGDLQAGMRTIAVALGRRQARRIGIAVMMAATCCLIWVAHGFLGRSLAILSTVLLLSVLGWPRVEEGRRIQLSRVPMLLAALAVGSA
ncbi:MAG: UbiA family prenyltransferase [Acidobacteriaceae bacterium]|jgi:4-hydroxybenzoate polyprenyltransferase